MKGILFVESKEETELNKGTDDYDTGTIEWDLMDSDEVKDVLKDMSKAMPKGIHVKEAIVKSELLTRNTDMKAAENVANCFCNGKEVKLKMVNPEDPKTLPQEDGDFLILKKEKNAYVLDFCYFSPFDDPENPDTENDYQCFEDDETEFDGSNIVAMLRI